MKTFGLACEGASDKAVLFNILTGYFSLQNPAQDIIELQPPMDITDGGWRPLLQYLTSERFLDDIENNQFVILQIDTDVSADFGVIHQNESGHQLNTLDLINKTVMVMIDKMNEKEQDVYEYYQSKIIFAICVHSIECWLVAHYGTQTDNHKCAQQLTDIKPNKIQFTKKINSKCHHKLSLIFLDKSNIERITHVDKSFDYFINQLKYITVFN